MRARATVPGWEGLSQSLLSLKTLTVVIRVEMSARLMSSGGEMFTNLLDIIKNAGPEEAEPESSNLKARKQSLRKSFHNRVKKSCGAEEDKEQT